MFDRNHATDPTPGDGVGEPTKFDIHFTDIKSIPQTYYKYSSTSGDLIVADLTAAYGKPIKMSFAIDIPGSKFPCLCHYGRGLWSNRSGKDSQIFHSICKWKFNSSSSTSKIFLGLVVKCI